MNDTCTSLFSGIPGTASVDVRDQHKPVDSIYWESDVYNRVYHTEVTIDPVEVREQPINLPHY